MLPRDREGKAQTVIPPIGAKLSVWLVTLAKERPFGFLDHNLRWGDCLLGIHSLEKLYLNGIGELRLIFSTDTNIVYLHQLQWDLALLAVALRIL